MFSAPCCIIRCDKEVAERVHNAPNSDLKLKITGMGTQSAHKKLVILILFERSYLLLLKMHFDKQKMPLLDRPRKKYQCFLSHKKLWIFASKVMRAYEWKSEPLKSRILLVFFTYHKTKFLHHRQTSSNLIEKGLYQSRGQN